MIRFIMMKEFKDNASGLLVKELYTFMASVPALESALDEGGLCDEGYEHHSLLGVEVVDITGDGDEGDPAIGDDEELPDNVVDLAAYRALKAEVLAA